MRCVGIEAMLNNNLLTYTTQPLPRPERMDLAAVFFSQARLVQENILFGELHQQYALTLHPTAMKEHHHFFP